MATPIDAGACISRSDTRSDMAAIRKRWWILGAASVVALALGVLVLALVRGWLLDWAIDAAIRSSEGRLVVENVRRFDGVVPAGIAHRGFTVGRIAWTEPDGRHAELVDARISLRLRALLQRELHVLELDIRQLNIRTVASRTDVVLPESMHLPITLLVDNVAIERVRVEPPAGDAIEFRGVRCALDYREGQFGLTRIAATHDRGTVEARLKIADRQPYELDADARLFGKALPWPDPILVLFKARGPLTRLSVEGSSTVRDNPISISTELNALANQQNPKIAWSVSRLLPQRFIENIPDYELSANGLLSLVPAISTTLELRNANPGTVDEGKLPLSQANAELRVDDGFVQIDKLRLALPGNALVQGSARVDLDIASRPREQWTQHASADLKLERVVPASIYKGLTPADLSGTAKLDSRGLWLDLRDRGPLLEGGLAARGLVMLVDNRIVIEQGEFRARDGLLRASGGIAIDKPHDFTMQGEANRFELSRWLNWQPVSERPPVEGRLNGTLKVSGRLGDAPNAAVELKLRDSVLYGLPLAGSVTGLLSAPASVSALDARMTWGGSRLTARGGYGQVGDRLDLRLQTESLEQIDPRLSGRIDLTADLRGQPAAPTIRTQWNAGPLRARMGDREVFRLSSTRGSAEGSLEPGGALNAQLTANGVRADQFELSQLVASVKGTLASHQFSVSGVGAGQQLRASGQGEWLDANGPGWQGRLAQVDASGRVVFSVRQPVSLAVGPGRLLIEGLDAQAFSGRVRLERGQFADGRILARGDFNSVLLEDLIATAQRVSGTPVNAAAASSGIVVRADGRFDLTGSQLQNLTGALTFEARSQPIEGVSRADLRLDDGRLAGQLSMRLPSLAWARRFMGTEWQLDGRLALDAELGGSVSAPTLRGAVTGQGLRLEQRLLGWRFENGMLRGEFTGDELRLDELKLLNQSGFVTLSGALRLPREPMVRRPGGKTDFGTGRFRLIAEHLPFTTGPGQRFVLSGDTQLALDRDTVTWSGKLTADEGFIELKDLDAPSEPDDLIIVDARKPAAQARGGEPVASRNVAPRDEMVRVNADLQLDLGERFRVQGNGVDAYLRGAIQLQGQLPGVPTATGVVQVRDGSYRAYGQELKIERGRLIFTGRFDNPTIDIVALRKFLPVEAGIALSGTALSPRTRLVSQPEVPDADKLSWLVLGVSLEDASGNSQAAALQSAAMTLMSNENSELSGGLARTLGVDVLGVRGASSTSGFSGMQGSLNEPRLPGAGMGTAAGAASQQNVVTVGKRLSSRLFVSYEQGLRGVWNLLKIQYDISNRFSLRALTGSESAIDLLYFFSFD